MSRSKTIVAFGDSLTFGYGVKEENKWTNILAKSLGCRVINSGVCGNTSSEGLVRIEEDVLKYKPDYVIINFGMNDHFIKTDGSKEAKVSLEQFEENIEKIIFLTKQINAVPVLVTPNKIIEGNIGDENCGGGATYYYRRHPYYLYKNIGGANAQLKKYCSKIVELGLKHCIATLDINKLCESKSLYSIIINLTNSNEDDGVHINELGAKFYSENIYKTLKNLL
ncbi:GDSL-type esterase/lipase family protein [Clostridium swellfunianum]|uniref:SGNH/GDSL hydrolase family protein n=1 Tax=Clostridium swellfunianum TaxID=1367462 RepID=UPI00202FFFB1|nr:GDSL-type esterase/lipase family protein [Clostridium swellfunianum]MCM0647566.1 GDSL-type esterase/lipase family protein [Clostridium swellfunianum]